MVAGKRLPMFCIIWIGKNRMIDLQTFSWLAHWRTSSGKAGTGFPWCLVRSAIAFILESWKRTKKEEIPIDNEISFDFFVKAGWQNCCPVFCISDCFFVR